MDGRRGVRQPEFRSRLRPALSSSINYYTLEAATAGLGYCIAPWHLVMSEIHSGRLIAPFGFVESGYSYLVERRLPSNTKIDRFCAWLKDEAATMPAPESRFVPVGATES